MAGQRKRHSADFKAKVALEAIQSELTVAQLVSKHGVHQTMISAWRKPAIEGMVASFAGKAEAAIFFQPILARRAWRQKNRWHV